MWVEYELVARVAWVVMVCMSRNRCRTAACTYVNPCTYSNPCTFVNPDLPRTVCLFVCDAAAFCPPQPCSVCLSLLFFSYRSLPFYFASFCKPSAVSICISLYLLVCLFVFLFGCPLVNDCLPVWVLNVCMSCDRCEDAPQRHRPHDDNREINALSPHHHTQSYPQNHTHTVPCRTHIPIPILGPYKVAPSHITITTVCQAKLKQMCHSKPYKVGLK